MRYFSVIGTVGIALAALIAIINPSIASGKSEGFQSGFEEGGICFYEEKNYKGRKFCAKPGEKISQLKAPWDKNFASLRMEGKVLVYVCNKSHFGGSCRFLIKLSQVSVPVGTTRFHLSRSALSPGRRRRSAERLSQRK